MYSLSDLEYLMRRLRDPQTGCAWDLAQTSDSLIPHTLEEVYEVVDAIERQDWDNLEEELGDLVFQVVFYAQVASEQERFSLASVIDRVTAKLVRRHPHVFPDGTLASERHGDEDSATIAANWDAIKAQEKPAATSIVEQVPRAMPAMARAYKLQKKAAKQGFDWPDVDGALSKVHEEIDELACETDPQRMLDEAGDVLFSMINLLRKQGIDPETALRHANHKFSTRFQYIEQQAKQPLPTYSLAQLDVWWEAAKELERE